MSKVILIKGLPNVGKTYICSLLRKKNYKIISVDEVYLSKINIYYDTNLKSVKEYLEYRIKNKIKSNQELYVLAQEEILEIIANHKNGILIVETGGFSFHFKPKNTLSIYLEFKNSKQFFKSQLERHSGEIKRPYINQYGNFTLLNEYNYKDYYKSVNKYYIENSDFKIKLKINKIDKSLKSIINIIENENI